MQPLPSLILLPGLDGTGKLLSAFVRTLSADVDTRIIGYPTDIPLGYEALEERVRTSLPQSHPFVLLGESFSGPIAVRIAATPPANLIGVILCGSFVKSPFPLLSWAAPLSFLVPVKSLPRWFRALFMWGSDIARTPRQKERGMASVASAVIRRRIAALLTVDATRSLSQIRIPVLVLHATRDRVVPYSATQWLSEHLPQAQFAPIDGPHLLLQSRPLECAEIILRFVRSRARGSAARQ